MLKEFERGRRKGKTAISEDKSNLGEADFAPNTLFDPKL